jgi:hypothetical protein
MRGGSRSSCRLQLRKAGCAGWQFGGAQQLGELAD